jgi:hypothetical protein
MPTILNRKGLSESWINAWHAYHAEYDQVGWRSATALIESPRIVLLQERHWDEIVIDIADEIFMILGSAVHNVLAASSGPNVISEQRVTLPFAGKELAFKADRIEPIPGTNPQEYHLKDYKITKVWAWNFGAKAGQIAQANLYRYAYKKTMQLNITKLSLEMLLRDWSDLDALKRHDYPDAEVMPLSLPVWDDDKTEKYLGHRVGLFSQQETVPDNQIVACTEHERWSRPDKYAVQKKGGKRAIRVFDTQAEANKYVESKKKSKDRKVREAEYEVDFRAGENVRCERFCRVRRWCNQYHTQLNPAF